MTIGERNRQKAAERVVPGYWFPLGDDAEHACDRCGARKPKADFGMASGGRWRKATCRECVRAELREKGRRTAEHPGLRLRPAEVELPEAVIGTVRPAKMALWLCPLCRARGIISQMARREGPCVPECGYGRISQLEAILGNPRPGLQDTGPR